MNMAKLSVILREKKREMLVLKYAQKIIQIKEKLKNPNIEMDEIMSLRK